MKLTLRMLCTILFTMVTVNATKAQSQNGVVFLDHAKVAEAFKKGEVLIAADTYRVQAGFRDKAGVPEVHDVHLDIFYVTEGTATFITGGTLVEPKANGPGEIQGKDIKGGETRTLTVGDVIVIPAKVPHWFKDTSKSFKYFVVKVKT